MVMWDEGVVDDVWWDEGDVDDEWDVDNQSPVMWDQGVIDDVWWHEDDVNDEWDIDNQSPKSSEDQIPRIVIDYAPEDLQVNLIVYYQF